MLIDTHAHLDFSEFEQDIDEVIERAAEAGVTRIITIGTSLKSCESSIALADRYEQVYVGVGIHPTCEPEQHPDAIGALRKLASHPKVVAIGETGLDFHRLPSSRSQKRDSFDTQHPASQADNGAKSSAQDDAYKDAQRVLFRKQLDLAAELGLNVVIHQRDAWQETVGILQEYAGQFRAVFHCFGGTPDQARTVYELGHVISFTGIVTFKNAGIVRETAVAAPDNGFMLETDCPYLAPVPYRGKRCEPAFAMETAKFIADLRTASIVTIAQQTTQTAEHFFRFPPERRNRSRQPPITP